MTPQQIKALWTLLGQTWGNKFLDQYGVEPNEAWSATLAHVSTEAARYALKQLIGEYSPFPPTLPEFIGWAKKYRESSVKFDANGRAYMGDEPDIVRLAPPERDPEMARENLRRLREMLKL